MAVGSIQPFQPATTVTVSATSASSATQIAGNQESILIYNASGSVAFVAVGTDSTTAATVAASFPVPAGASRMITVGSYFSWVAVILASGTGTVYVSRGNGTSY